MRQRRKMPPVIMAAALALAGGAAVPAQDLDLGDGLGEGLDELFSEEETLSGESDEVVTVGAFARRVDRTPSNVYVIDEEQLRAFNAKHPAEALSLVPGLSVFRRHQRGYEISAFGSGWIFSNKVLVLVDGHRVTDPGFGNVYWQLVPALADDVQRIEVVLGPESVTYGSNAFSAVVNFITRRKNPESGTEAVVRFGNDDYSTVSFSTVEKLDDGYARFFFQRDHQDQQKAAQNAATGAPIAAFAGQGDNMANKALRFQVERLVDEDTNVHMALSVQDSNLSGYTGLPVQGAPNSSSERALSFAFDLDHALRKERHFKVRFTLNDQDRDYFAAPFANFQRGERDFDTSLADLELRLEQRTGPWSLAFGTGARKATTSGYVVDPGDDDGFTSSVFARGEREFGDKFVLFLGMRQDFSDYTDDNFSWKIAGLYRPSPDVGWRLSVGSSFRAPDLIPARLRTLNIPVANSTLPLATGNRNLRSEESRGFVQFGWEKTWKKSRVKLDFYTARLEGLIDLQTVGTIFIQAGPGILINSGQTGASFVNTPDTKVRGATLAFDHEFGNDWHVALGVNVQNRSGGTTAQLPNPIYAPDFKGSLSIYRPTPERGWGGALTILTVGDYATDNSQAQINGGARAFIEGYTTVDLTASRGVGNGYEVGLTLKNLTDKKHIELNNNQSGTDVALEYGREAYLTVRKNF